MSLKIEAVLCRAGTMDNYAWVLTDEQSGKSAVVDASEAAPVIDYCTKAEITPEFILTTHHHFDHVGGNLELKTKYNLKIIGPEAEKQLIPGIDIGLQDGDSFELGNSRAEVLAAPGHTLGHIMWYFADAGALFTGDVLFNLSVGGLFEGTPEQMRQTLLKINELPAEVMFYPGHEYTLASTSNALHHNPGKALEQYICRARNRLAQGLPVAPVSLAEEKQCNPWLHMIGEDNSDRMF